MNRRHKIFSLNTFREVNTDRLRAQNSKGDTYSVTVLSFKSIAGLRLILLDEEYSRYLGYENREHMLTEVEQQALSEEALYHEPFKNKLYIVINRAPVCLN